MRKIFALIAVLFSLVYEALLYLLVFVVFSPVIIIKAIYTAVRAKAVPLEEAIEKAEFFLRPQIMQISDKYDDKLSVVSLSSLSYALGVGEGASRRKILDAEYVDYFVGVFGEDYRDRINFLLAHEAKGLRNELAKLKDIVRADLSVGMLRCSNFLVHNAMLNSVHLEVRKQVS